MLCLQIVEKIVLLIKSIILVRFQDLTEYYYSQLETEKAGCFAFIVLQMYYYYKCSVALPHGAVGWSQNVIVVFPDHAHLLFVSKQQ